jgi:hypothetical protein
VIRNHPESVTNLAQRRAGSYPLPLAEPEGEIPEIHVVRVVLDSAQPTRDGSGLSPEDEISSSLTTRLALVKHDIPHHDERLSLNIRRRGQHLRDQAILVRPDVL